jgi:EAL domain-containing protein (putative c-di-GMP-specific phosphodiesterase class I)
VHEVKIDRSFVVNMTSDSDDETIVRSIIDLAGNLSLDVVAEGVEDVASWNRLGDLGCTFAQGYYLSRPMPIAELPLWLAARELTHDRVVIPLMREAR